MNSQVFDERFASSIIWAGISGIISISCYIATVVLDLPTALTFFLAMLFPIGGIIFLYGIKNYIETFEKSAANDLSFIFGSLAFTICAVFLSAQIAVQSQIKLSSLSTEDYAQLKTIKKSLRLIDMGIDVAWDLFIGTSLILLTFASKRIGSIRIFGRLLGVLGVALIIVNTLTYPTPPADASLIDLGPLIALTLFAMAIRLVQLGRRMYASLRRQ